MKPLKSINEKPKAVKFLNNPRIDNAHKWVKTWKTLWLLPIIKPNYILREDMIVELTFEGGKKYKKTIKAGYECDLASIPSILWKFWLPDSVKLEAVNHDTDYEMEIFNRWICDSFFKFAMISKKRPPKIAKWFYRAVNVFGWSVWIKHKKNKVLEKRKFVTIEETK